MAERTTLWTLTNEFQQKITCTMEQVDPNTYRIVVCLEDDEVVTELHYTAASAITRARALRDSLACRSWVPEA